RAEAVDDSVIHACARAIILETVDIFLLVTEFQRINGHFRRFKRGVLTIVEEETQTVLCLDAHVMTRGGDHKLVALKVLVKHHFTGRRILDPEVFRHFTTAEHRIDLRTDVVGDPVHDVWFRFLFFGKELQPPSTFKICSKWTIYWAASRRVARTLSA